MRLDQQALGVIGVGRHHDLQAGHHGEQRMQGLAVLRAAAQARADRGADHHRGLGLAAEHVAELGGLVVDLVEADADEVDEHDLGHRPHAGHAPRPRRRR